MTHERLIPGKAPGSQREVERIDGRELLGHRRNRQAHTRDQCRTPAPPVRSLNPDHEEADRERARTELCDDASDLALQWCRRGPNLADEITDGAPPRGRARHEEVHARLPGDDRRARPDGRV